MIRINGNKTVESTVGISPNNDFPNGVGAYHLANTPELYEPQRNNNFMFEIGITLDSNGNLVDLYRAGINQATEGSAGYAKFANPDEIIRVSVDSASIPTYSQNVITVHRGNTSVRYAGRIEFKETFPIKLVDYIGAESKDILLAWQALSGNPYTEKVGHASDYKKRATLCEYTPDYQLVRRWIIEGCWLQTLDFGTYQYQNTNDKVEIEATVVFDRCYIDTKTLSD